MPFRKLTTGAGSPVAAGKPASSHLAHVLRDNDLYLDAVAQGADALLSESAGGHLHTTGTATTSHEFVDRVRIISGVNDRLDFYHGGGASAAAVYAATLTAGVYAIDSGGTSLVAHLQARMRAATGTTDIAVTYDAAAGSLTRGLILIRHTGATDSPNARALKLLFGSGANTARSVAKDIGFEARDRIGAFGYAGTSGFRDGFEQDSVTLGDGGLITAAGLQSNAAITAKFAGGVVGTAALATDAVHNDNTEDGAITATKAGPTMVHVGSLTSGGGIRTFTITMPGSDGAARPPIVCAPTGNITCSVAHTSGQDFLVTVTNSRGDGITVDLDVCYL